MIRGVKAELTRIRKDLENECASYGDIAFLYEHQKYVMRYFPTDSFLWENSGIPESKFREMQYVYNTAKELGWLK